MATAKLTVKDLQKMKAEQMSALIEAVSRAHENGQLKKVPQPSTC